ncbi:diguanylate cyclase domain-containing protein [Acetobacterium woodii]|uniref:Response regulator-like protein n=1 Tax=Acetobacterium woodii (strain ATCC 29683 / DSM 1030 / JCM 2381 / KCTC 1655 / WB1) TaxID=931626 RepID=H6LF17_ACEWD|nr:diguanylate cyclase [Acetobacterium woodii]AFA46923.1 response regulator-like protein [Acetobacterium woodii DSM 1030]
MDPVAMLNLLVTGLIIAIAILLVLLNQRNKSLEQKKEEIKYIRDTRDAFLDEDNRVVYLKDENLHYLFINKAGEKHCKKPVSEIIGQDDRIFDMNVFGTDNIKIDQQVIKNKEPIIYEERYHQRFYKIAKFPVKLKAEKIGVGAFVREITFEEKLIKKQERVLFRNRILVNVLSKHFRNDKKQLDYVLHEALKLTGSNQGFICLYDEEKAELTLYAWSKGLINEAAEAAPKKTYQLADVGLWGEAVRQRKAFIMNKPLKENAIQRELSGEALITGNFMAVPLFMDGKISAVAVFSDKNGDYDTEEVDEISVLLNGVLTSIERHHIQEKLFKERSKYLQTLISIGDGVMIVDTTGKIEMLNKVAQRLTGWSNEMAKGRYYKDVFVLSHEDGDQEIQDPIARAIATDRIQELENHALLTAKNGSIFYLEDSAAPIKDEQGKTVGIVLVFRDVSEKKAQRKEIEYLSFHDALTGLYNRRFFEEEIRRLDTFRNLPISIIMGDVNGLKLTNDIFGHAYGDNFLKEIARVMRKICREDDIIARWGGDEFVILLPKTTIQQAKQIKERIKIEFAKAGVKVIKGNISLGCDVKNNDNQDIMDCLEIAEEKMYAAKILERDDFKSSTLDSIVTSLKSESPWEEEHAQRVSKWCYDLGVWMELSHVKVRKLKLAGYFHDIGKIVLEKKLLIHNGEFSNEERNEIKKHPIMGYRILNAFDDTMSLADAVLYHHERWDGSGYPEGLKGEEIPFLARVVAIADYYDWLCYDFDEAVQKVNQKSLADLEKTDGLFDPEIVREFIKMIENSSLENSLYNVVMD